jgi:D-alanine transfer protein
MHAQSSAREITPHLGPALTALVLGVVGLLAFEIYARWIERRSIKALAADEAIIARQGQLPRIKNQGVALQLAAWETDGLLPVYGSSELNLQAPYNRPFQPTALFRAYPTGFTIFPVGKAETTCLLMTQKLAAVGPLLEGRKVAISLSPYWFFDRLTARSDAYAGNFSALQAGELAFNCRLSLRLRQDVARRMLQYPATLANRPLLQCALENLADGSWASLACYGSLLPLGFLHNSLLRDQDHWSVLIYLWKHPRPFASPKSPPGEQPLDWALLHHKADDLYRTRSDNNPLGLDNQKWDGELRRELLRLRNTRSDVEFLRALASNEEWGDLDLLLRLLTECGARTLLLSMPIHGGWYDACGVTLAARKAYYQKLRAVGARYHAAVVDFADHDGDPTFCHDNLGHLAPGGLVAYSEVLDRFFHDLILSKSATRAPDYPSIAPGDRRLILDSFGQSTR